MTSLAGAPAPFVTSHDPRAQRGPVRYACGHTVDAGFGPARTDPEPCEACHRADGTWPRETVILPRGA